MVGKRGKTKTPHVNTPVSVASNQVIATNSYVGGRMRSFDDLQTLTKEQLKLECRKRGQKTTGTKNELLQRLGHKMNTTKRNTNTSNGSATIEDSSNSTQMTQSSNAVHSANKALEKAERESIVLWKKPLLTLEYFGKEVFELSCIYGNKLFEYRKLVLLLVSVLITFAVTLNLDGPHQSFIQQWYKKLLWCLYWTGLGILSSVGLGTGLHTFLLYLGPHIAQVTLAAYECNGLNFPEPPYPDEIICPTSLSGTATVSILSIMSKVRLESMCWGAGTALGELPPYFMARAARLSGIDPDEEDELAEFEELQRKNKEDLTLMEKGKLLIEDIVQKVGFLGILACASIPNPLFDLAGITCGHFLVPFWTFFGATLIGKAIIKMHIQKLFVIIAFNEALITTALSWLHLVPVVGESLQTPFKAFLDDQKSKLHRRGSPQTTEKSNILGSIFEKFVIVMILYFVLSIVNSLAQSYHKRLHKRKKTN
ncbi:membrane-associated progesterone receptor component-related [Holotrichia oblita]|uniref:Membrane-associated progesterone receptor component-related n=2 Tax=Holotrichia oblita TaxID=644536 RepID=A0ACB9SLN5_HOLOL|nr:membrane-associated progesterone receptor component-related [Holotrichia oblita]KAI4454622.1 membrane-associated progesterone receptor component-related [Holotrichia oblita]